MIKKNVDLPLEIDLFIDNKWIPSLRGQRFKRFNPADGELVVSVAQANAEDALRAVQAARSAFDHGPWPRTSPAERAGVLIRAAGLIEENKERLAVYESATCGAPLNQTLMMMDWIVDVFFYFAGISRTVAGETHLFTEQEIGLTFKEPVGVVSQLIPWNFPLNQAAWKICPALAAGCTIVAKPDIKTAVTTLILGELLAEAGLPKGVLNVITGDPADLSSVLTEHPDIDMVSLTGSTTSGKTVMRNAAASVKRVHLELGGKSPNLVFAGADLDAAARSTASSVFFRSGQICTAASRVLVEESVHDEFLELFEKHAAQMTVGDPKDSSSVLGPMISEEQMRRVEDYIDVGVRSGARKVVGGKRLSGGIFDNGYYLPPTIFDHVDPGMAIAQEEIFGPVASVLTFRDAEDAITLANQTIYGLASAVWTSDISTALQMSRRLKAGTVWINAYGLVHAELPVGGYKMSGHGRELGVQGLDEYLQTKSVHFNLTQLGG
ncbi:MAG TPA: aldehyde dehydrogenase family protein [Spirochaetia bacterium]|nr:aldehyde dehydrogenase family protein [Spirochaetia bacterium]